MAAEDSRGLFEPAPSAAPTSPAGAPTSAAAERRSKLYNYDAAAVQALNPYGKSQFSEAPLEQVWAMVTKGNKKVAFHSELCSHDDWRVGVGLSRTAETLLEGIAALQEDNIGKLLKPEILKQALDEADTLKPHLEALNFGKGSEKQSTQFGTLSQMKKRKLETAAMPPGQDAVKEAADTLRAWFQKDASPLRAIFTILAGAGSFWAAHVAERVGRAAILHKPLEGPQIRAAALARRKEPVAATASTPNDDARGLAW